MTAPKPGKITVSTEPGQDQAVGLTRSLYLKELYVAESHRRRAVGRLLMQKMFDVALETQCSRVEWATDDSNPVAQRFYAQLGYRAFLSKISYRVEGEAALQAAAG